MPLPPLNTADLQPFLDNPEQLASETRELQLAIANYPATPRNLLEVLTRSGEPQVAQTARLHVNWAGEIAENWREALDAELGNVQLGENDRLAVVLLKFAPVPDRFLSEWVPAERLIEGLRNPHLPMRYRLKLLERLAKEPTLEPRLQVAESAVTPLAVLELLAGDLELQIRLAVKFNANCPPQLIELVEGQHAVATDWNTDTEQLAMLGQSRWAWIRLAVAQNPYTPPETLMQLAGDSVFKIQLAVANNPQTPANVLALLAEHPEQIIQEVVAEHSNATEEILHQVFPTQQQILINRKNLPTSILERFFREATNEPFWKQDDLQNLLVGEPNTPTWILLQLVNVDIEEFRKYKINYYAPSLPSYIVENNIKYALNFLADIAKHPQVSGEILKRLSEYSIPDVQLAVAQNSLTPEALRTVLLEQLINSYDGILTQLASDRNTPVTILEQLAHASSIANLAVDTIRQMLPASLKKLVHPIRTFITNQQSPQLIWFWLRQDPVFREPILEKWRQLLADLNESDRVNFEAFCRQILPPINEIVAETNWLDEYEYPSPEFDLYGFLLRLDMADSTENSIKRNVYVALVGNPNTPAPTREQLKNQLARPSIPLDSYDGDRDLFLALAYNSAIPEAERREYFQQLITLGRAGELVARDPRTPLDILEQLSELGEKEGIAKNPAVPESLLRRIADEPLPHDWILRTIAENPNAPADLLLRFIKQPHENPTQSNVSMLDLVLKNPNLPILERYRLLLEKEQDRENAKAREFMSRRPNSTYGLAEVVKSGDKQALYNAARNSLSPIHILEQLAKHPDETVRGVLLENRNLPLKIRLELTRDPSSSVRCGLARKNPHRETPVQVLEILADDESEQVREFVAENPHTPIEVLEKLSNDRSHKVKQKVVRNRNTPVNILTRLGLEENIYNVRNPNTPGVVLDWAATTIPQRYGYKSDEVLADFLKHPVQGSQMPASSLEQLANHSSGSVRYRVADHPNTPVSALEKLARDSYVSTVRAVASNRNTPPHILEQLATHADYTTRNSVAGNPNTPPAALELLVRYKESQANAPSKTKDALKSMMAGADNNQIRKIIAGNPRTPLAVLEMLATRDFVTEEETRREPDPLFGPRTPEEVLQSLVYNPSLTPEILARLAIDPSPKIRSLLVRHPNMTPEIWEQLARDEDAEVRIAIASHPNCPISLLETLATDDEKDIRQKVAANLNTPLNILEFMSRDLDAKVREAIASNPNTTPSILEQLAPDEKVEVRRAVAKNPHTPATIRESLQELIVQPFTRQSSPTLRGLGHVYDPNTDDLPTLLSEYVQSPNAFVRFVALLHPLIPVETLQQGIQSLSWADRYAVADNPSTPVEMRQQLTQDSNRIVRAAAKSNLPT